jgi:hypothetical protein
LLSLYPARFQAEFADEMAQVFAEQLRAARLAGGSQAELLLWVRGAFDLLATAPAQHLRREAPVPQSIDPVRPTVERRAPRAGFALHAMFGLLPVWLFLYLAAAAPRFLDPVFEGRVAMLGIPFGIVLVAIAMLWTGVGMIALRRARPSRLGASMVLLLFAGPASILVVLAPSLVLAVAAIDA